MLGQWCEAIYIHIHYIFSSSINFISWKMWKIRNFINRRFHPLVLQATSYNFIFCTNKIPLHLQDVTINRLPALTKVGMHISSFFYVFSPDIFYLHWLISSDLDPGGLMYIAWLRIKRSQWHVMLHFFAI